MPQLTFSVPFSGFAHHCFFNDFAAVHVYLSETNLPLKSDYSCAKKETGSCTSCGNCRRTIKNVQEDWYFLLETMAGAASLMQGQNNTSAPDPIDFCMKFTGYSYRIVMQDFRTALEASIQNGYPVLARMKDAKYGEFRVLIGFDGELLIAAENTGVQNPPPAPPTYAEIDALYLITGKTAPPYTLLDGLRNLERSLSESLELHLWDELENTFDYWHAGLNEIPFEELKKRFAHAKQIGWNFDHCHNVAEVFRHRVIPALRDSRLDEFCRQIDRSYDSSHDCQWTLIALHDCRDWSKRRWESLEAGMCMCVRWTIQQLKQNDLDVLAAVRGMISALS